MKVSDLPPISETGRGRTNFAQEAASYLAEIRELTARVESVERKIAALIAENTALRSKIVELEERGVRNEG